MFIANRKSANPEYIWVSGTTKAELKKLGISPVCIVHKGFDYLYQIKRCYLKEV